MKSVLLIFVGLLSLSIEISAQDYVNSLYQFTENRINPALASSSDFQSASFLFRRQYAIENTSFNSSYAEFKHPIYNGKRRWSGLNLSLLNDQSTGADTYESNSINLSYSVNVPLNKYSQLSAGIGLAFQSRQLSTNGFSTGSQYVEYVGFDTSLPDGEGSAILNNNHLNFSTGVYWEKVDRWDESVFSAGFAFYNLNQPNASFYDRNEERLPVKAILTGSARYWDNYQWSIYQEALIQTDRVRYRIVSGPVVRYKINSYANQYLDFQLKYASSNSIITGLVYSSKNFLIGTSYDLNLLKNNVSNRSSFEVSISARRLRKVKLKKKKREIVREEEEIEDSNEEDENSKEVEEEFNADELEENNTEPSDTIKVKTEAGIITYLPAELEDLKHDFYFDFNDFQLSKEDEQYLKDITAILSQNKKVRILVTGHTDHTGDEEYNLKLSQERARKIGVLFLKNGISKRQIRLVAKGEAEPIADNNTVEGRAINRRVTVELFFNY